MNPNPGDPTPSVGSPTDVAPLGLLKSTPPHEQIAAEGPSAAEWQSLADTVEFKQLLREKAAFTIPACLFFIIYYFALLVLNGYEPQLMDRPVLGTVNIAYLFALSQFFMAWVLAALYMRASGRFDELAARVVRKWRGSY